MANGIAAKTSRAIAAFQDYLEVCSTEGRRSWTGAKPLIQEAASLLAGDLCGPNEPTPVEQVALSLDVQLRYAVELPVAGSLAKIGNGLELLLKAPDIARAPRFTVAHELGHALFYRHYGHGVHRIVPVRAVGSNESRRDEALCDDFARALLIPSQSSVLHLAMESRPLLEEVLNLSQRAETSPIVLLKRVVHDNSGWQDCVFYQINVLTRKAVTVRGKQKRRANDAPSGPHISRFLSHFPKMDSVALLRVLVSEVSPLRGCDMIVDGNQIWARSPGIKKHSRFLPLS